ncbi:cyclopropane-fatty-acyl-phospholipid synthase [Fontimonas thermophila]|uniref:Cyclopropane-fatty-acyl-phospholipid synthase n=1 Tax=Fontimonas thermophila TaxID=1076937 RepID=A0A1I2IAZ8_9GAMM|nr:cyclopropane-fatty-acyl-phospholipid synthase family protein [Fontimonas thermophila]SFF39512.1 cyclopropane-fatty-acyl-phospholipid synthase [Fontimonas thermophila]
MTDSITSYAERLSSLAPKALLPDVLRRILLKRLAGLSEGAILLCEPNREPVRLGAADASPIRVDIHDPAFYGYACLGGSVGLGEAYMLDLWSTPDLVGVTRLLIRNSAQLEALDEGLARLRLPLLKLFEWQHRNDPRRSRRNIAAHYDLGNDFFRLFLDRSMTYSSAIYTAPDDTLERAQFNKLDTICRKLDLGPGDHVVEIGSGWGSFALHAAGRYGARVTTTTISREQHRLASERVAEAGLSDRVEVLLADYRELQGCYDKLVSIEMIEAVGHAFYPVYLQTCARLLKPRGRALIQAITCADQRYEAYRASSDFIRRYIFPGGNLPSVTHLLDVATAHTDLRLVHLEDFSQDYARTLAEWRSRFWQRNAEVRALGYGERFIRMWDFYLAICEAGFAEHYNSVVHLMFARQA